MRTMGSGACLSGIVCLSMAIAAVAGLRWYSQRILARRAVEELAICRQIAAEIDSGRGSPQRAMLERQSDQQISLLIERAAQEAEILDSEILRITPQPGLRRTKSIYVEQPTAVQLRQVSLIQLSRFLGELGISEAGLQPTSIRLTAPRTRSSTLPHDDWTCELVLTYLVFSPE